MNNDNNNEKYRQQLFDEINKIKNKIKFKQERLKYNICAGVCKKSILVQRKEINKLELQITVLEYKYQHKL